MGRSTAHLFVFGAFMMAAGGLSSPAAQGAPVTFFGEDLNFTEDPSTPEDDPLRPASIPNADSAHAAFLANLVGVTTENFEGFAPGASTPLILTFGADTATLSGTAHIPEVPTGTLNGTYPISGNKFLFQFGGSGTFQIQFSSPQAGLGFYATDVGELGQLIVTLIHDGGGTTVLNVPHTVPSGSGSALYFGVLDTDDPFTLVVFSNTLSAIDGFGFDDMTIAPVPAVVTTTTTTTTTSTISTTEPTTTTTSSTTSTTEEPTTSTTSSTTTTSSSSTTTTTSTTTSTTTTLPGPVCGPTPAVGCRTGLPLKSSIQLKDSLDDTKDQIKWKLNRGDATAPGDFMDPVGGSAHHNFCVYDGSASPQPLLEAIVWSGGICDEKPCWKATSTTGFKYKNKLATPNGVTHEKLKAGIATKAQVMVKAKGILVTMPTLPLTTPVTAQLLITDGLTMQCWQTVFPTFIKNDPAQFRAKGP